MRVSYGRFYRQVAASSNPFWGYAFAAAACLSASRTVGFAVFAVLALTSRKTAIFLIGPMLVGLIRQDWWVGVRMAGTVVLGCAVVFLPRGDDRPQAAIA